MCRQSQGSAPGGMGSSLFIQEMQSSVASSDKQQGAYFVEAESGLRATESASAN